MKKLPLLALFMTLPIAAFALQITKVNYNIQGCGAKIFGVTQDYVLAREVPVDTKTDFADETALNHYLEDYKKKAEQP